MSFLHVYHHMSISLVIGSVVWDTYNADMYLPIMLNSIVHVLMYQVGADLLGSLWLHSRY